MKAYLLTKFDSPEKAFRLVEMPTPEPGPGQVLIRVSAFGLNYADIMARQGLYRELPPLPCVPGYDVEGEVVSTGLGVTSLKPGDRVLALTRFGGYAEYAVTNSQVVGLLPGDAPVGMGTALAVHGATACHSAMRAQTLLPGEKVLVHAAAGGLGTCLIQLAKHFGCITIGVAGGKTKADYLRTLGVDHIIDHHITDYRDYVRQHLGGRVDVVFDNVGGKSIHHAMQILARGGRVISLGAAALSGKKGKLNLVRLALGFGVFSPVTLLTNSQSLIGVNMLKLADDRPDRMAVTFSDVQSMYTAGVLRPHIGNVFHHTALAEAHTLMEQRGSIGKIAVTW